VLELAVLLDERTRLLVQGITGHQGQFHTRAMLDYDTKVVAGVTPGKAGETVHGVPVFDSCFDAVDETGANASIMFVPAPYAKDAAVEAIEAGVKLLVVITERIPFHDTLDVVTYARAKGCRVIGPNCPGLISPGKAKAGIMPNHIFRPGDVGVISRSGTLTYEIVHAITEAGFGESACLGIGGGPGEAGAPDAEAHLRVHRGSNRAPGKADGACGRNHLPRNGNRAEQDRCVLEGADSRRGVPRRHRPVTPRIAGAELNYLFLEMNESRNPAKPLRGFDM